MRRTVLLLIVALWGVSMWAQSGPPATGGNGTLYLGGFPNKLWVIDEATERVVSAIALTKGTPRQLTLSPDRTRFYLTDVTNEHIEIVDIAARRSIDSFTLTEGARRVRIRSYEVDPLHRFAILLVHSITKLVDRFEIGSPKLVQYDLTAHQVMREIPWPEGRERTGANMLFSPDGKLLYFFADDVLILETENFTQVDKWALSQPLEDGFGRIDFGFTPDTINDAPGYFTGVFRVQDPVQNRRLMGIARIDLPTKHVEEFYTLGPDTSLSFALAPDRKTLYGLSREIGQYEFWTFNLDARRLEKRQPFEGRPRMALKTSSNGRILYVYQAGNTIDLYETESYRYLRTITLDGDMTTPLYVVPNQAPTASRR